MEMEQKAEIAVVDLEAVRKAAVEMAGARVVD